MNIYYDLKYYLTVIFNYIWYQMPQALMSLSDNQFLLILAFFSLIALAAFIGGVYYFKQFRAIADMPTSKIRSAAQGYVEFEGKQKLLPNYTLYAPLSKEACTWYSYQIERKTALGYKGEAQWNIIAKGVSPDLILLDDGTCKCYIDPKGAKILGTKPRIWFGNRRNPNGFHISFYSANKKFRYTEMIMRPNTYLYALGNLRTEKLSYFAGLKRYKNLTKLLPDDSSPIHMLSNEEIHGRPFMLSVTKEKILILKSRIKTFGFLCFFFLIMTYLFHLMILREIL